MCKFSIVSNYTLIPIKSVVIKVNTFIYSDVLFYRVVLPDFAHKEKFQLWQVSIKITSVLFLIGSNNRDFSELRDILLHFDSYCFTEFTV